MTEAVSYLGSLGTLQLVGVAGFLTYILAFSLVQFEYVDGNGSLYSGLNVLAASLVGISLFAEFNLSSALIQASWIIIGLIGLIRRVVRPKSRASKFDTARPIGGLS